MWNWQVTLVTGLTSLQGLLWRQVIVHLASFINVMILVSIHCVSVSVSDEYIQGVSGGTCPCCPQSLRLCSHAVMGFLSDGGESFKWLARRMPRVMTTNTNC